MRLRALCYNIRHAQGVGGVISTPRIARVIDGTCCDLVALAEVWRVEKRFDQPALLARLTGMEAAFDPLHSVMGREAGNAVLSKRGFVATTHIDLGGKRERRGCLVADVEVSGVRFAFAATHLSLDSATRALQLQLLAEALPTNRPLVLMGDFNCSCSSLGPLSDVFQFPAVPPRTYPSPMPFRSLDHVGFSRDWRLVSLETVRTWASDHLPLVAELEYLGSG